MLVEGISRNIFFSLFYFLYPFVTYVLALPPPPPTGIELRPSNRGSVEAEERVCIESRRRGSALRWGEEGQLRHLYKGHPSGDPAPPWQPVHLRGVGLTLIRLLLPWKPLYSWPSAACCSTWGISPRSVSLFCSSSSDVSQLRPFL